MCRDEAAAGQPYPFGLSEAGDLLRIDCRPLFRAIVEDLLREQRQAKSASVSMTDWLKRWQQLRGFCVDGHL